MIVSLSLFFMGSIYIITMNIITRLIKINEIHTLIQQQSIHSALIYIGARPANSLYRFLFKVW
jgi:hypothetical protein